MYSRNWPLTLAQFISLYRRSTLGERRPVGDPATMRDMMERADLTITAWDDEQLVGIARTLTDFSYVAYLSDLAVDAAYQKQGIGRQLVAETRKALGADCMMVLLAAPKAQGYYPRIGFEQHGSAWILKAGQPLT